MVQFLFPKVLLTRKISKIVLRDNRIEVISRNTMMNVILMKMSPI